MAGRHVVILSYYLTCMISFFITLSIQVSLCFISSLHIFAHLLISGFPVKYWLLGLVERRFSALLLRCTLIRTPVSDL